MLAKSPLRPSTEEFLKTHKRAQETPQKKYEFPQTEAQEYGWDTSPGELELELEDQRSCCMVHVHGTFYIFSLNGQVDPLRHDPRLNHPRQHSEITKYMDAYWRQKEQENLQQ